MCVYGARCFGSSACRGGGNAGSSWLGGNSYLGGIQRSVRLRAAPYTVPLLRGGEFVSICLLEWGFLEVSFSRSLLVCRLLRSVGIYSVRGDLLLGSLLTCILVCYCGRVLLPSAYSRKIRGRFLFL